MNRPCISLLTDFGLHDTYVGQMKGAIAAINPAANVVDLTHAIPPQQVLQAAIALADAVDPFPAGTIHVAVVDPGVGSSRRAIAAEIGSQKFVCPDNGLLSVVLRRQQLRRAVLLDQPRWWTPAVSHTFHGRDLFAPVAAAWSLGHDLSEFGSPLVEPLMELSLPDLVVDVDAVTGQTIVRGCVLAVDHFGNLVTNVPRAAIPLESTSIEVIVGQTRLRGIERCYSDRGPGECLALFGSSGRLEIAVVNGNAARLLEMDVGNAVMVMFD